MSAQRLSEDELVNIERALLMDFNWADHVQAIAYCGSAKNEVIPGLLVTVRSLEAENVRLREALREARVNADDALLKRIDSLLSEGERG